MFEAGTEPRMGAVERGGGKRKMVNDLVGGRWRARVCALRVGQGRCRGEGR
ncbi:MAG: hypothetical protein JSV79_02650 [Armatimonadota bacterium]|nr:MAG: hypothetical protein JSV79_02650 [Armatimonadota bacterium]